MTDTNAQFISKNWLISILVGLVCFFGALGISDNLTRSKDNDARLIVLENRLLVIETQYRYIKETLDEIKAEVKK